MPRIIYVEISITNFFSTGGWAWWDDAAGEGRCGNCEMSPGKANRNQAYAIAIDQVLKDCGRDVVIKCSSPWFVEDWSKESHDVILEFDPRLRTALGFNACRGQYYPGPFNRLG